MATTPITSLWIDGQAPNGSRPPVEIQLHRDGDGFRWYGPDDEDTSVSADTVEAAIEAAEAAWGGSTWRLRDSRD